jgi:Uncharacterized copper-binding protein
MFGNRSRQSVLAIAGVVALAAAGCSSAGATPTPTVNPTPTAAIAIATATPAPTPTPGPTITYPTIDFTPGTVAVPREIDVTADDDLNFSPNVIVVAEGETVSFKITSVGKAVHEFMIGPADAAFSDTEGTPEVQDLKKGVPQTLTFTFEGPGPFAFACHEPGHFEHGMKGWIIVVGPDVPKVGTVANPRLVHIDMSDKLKFDPGNVVVAPGEAIRFLITNSGEKATHELALGPADKVAADEIDGTLVVEADEIEPGMMKDLAYTFDGPGPYGFACHEPGHFEAGMVGSIVFTTN